MDARLEHDEDVDVDTEDEAELLLRASCPDCGKELLGSGKVYLLTVCGHLQCGSCSDQFIPLSGEYCGICGLLPGPDENKIELKI